MSSPPSARRAGAAVARPQIAKISRVDHRPYGRAYRGGDRKQPGMPRRAAGCRRSAAGRCRACSRVKAGCALLPRALLPVEIAHVLRLPLFGRPAFEPVMRGLPLANIKPLLVDGLACCGARRAVGCPCSRPRLTRTAGTCGRALRLSLALGANKQRLRVGGSHAFKALGRGGVSWIDIWVVLFRQGAIRVFHVLRRRVSTQAERLEGVAVAHGVAPVRRGVGRRKGSFGRRAALSWHGSLELRAPKSAIKYSARRGRRRQQLQCDLFVSRSPSPSR